MRSAVIRAWSAGVVGLLLIAGTVAAHAENDRLNTLLRVANALLSTRMVLQEDFEAPVSSSSNLYRAGQSFRTRTNNWQVESGSVDLINARARAEVAAYDGKQLLELAGSPGPGVVATRFATRAGQSYTLTLRYARNSGLGRTAARGTLLVLGARGTALLDAELVHEPAQLAFNAQSTYTGIFIADAAQASLRLSALNAGNYGMTVDGISIAPTQPGDVATSSAPAAPDSAPTIAAKPEDRAAFIVRCKRETIAAYAGAARQADSICGSKWDEVTASLPMADALLAVAPTAGARFDPAAARTKLTAVRWRSKPTSGQVSSGRLNEIDVGILNTPAPSLAFTWFKNGETIPFDLAEALKVRGVGLSMIGCLKTGAGEGSHVYRIAATGKAPFVLSISFRSAAVASQSSDYGAQGDFSGRLPTLASLQRDGNDWTATCLE